MQSHALVEILVTSVCVGEKETVFHNLAVFSITFGRLDSKHLMAGSAQYNCEVPSVSGITSSEEEPAPLVDFSAKFSNSWSWLIN